MRNADIFNIQPFSLRKAEKEKILGRYLNSLTRHHYVRCAPYRKIMDSLGYDRRRKYHGHELMFLPVRLFKMMELRSVPEEKIVRTLTSSGTSGQGRSMIFLDKENAENQAKALTRILSSFIGTQRMPMIIMDARNAPGKGEMMTAGTAGILGFSWLGSKKLFALNDRMELNREELAGFSEMHQDKRILVFGFTWKIYRYLILELQKAGIRPDLSHTVLIHGGGWKKLEKVAVSSEIFRERLKETCGIQRVHDYYGMAEQAGSIFMECEHGHYHASVFSDVIIRRPHDFSIAGPGEEGIIQVLSVLPKSYPGHSLLTEDKGILLGEDDCPCGRFGKYIRVTGRLEHTALKGCSDTYEERVD
jgi:phenylacetate-coenzyme A ligase PaaK-like adenylate-forming protein